MQAAFLALDPSVSRSTHLSRVALIATGGSPITNKVTVTLHIDIWYFLWCIGVTLQHDCNDALYRNVKSWTLLLQIAAALCEKVCPGDVTRPQILVGYGLTETTAGRGAYIAYFFISFSTSSVLLQTTTG